MAQGIGIYQLPEADALSGAESIPIDTGADTKRATVAKVREGLLEQSGDGSAVQVLQTLASASRSLAALFSDTTNAISWGAKGDNSTDDTARLQAAINRGGDVAFPKGNFRISQPLVVPSATTVRGFGNGTTNIIPTNPAQDVFVIGDGASLTENVVIRDMTITPPPGVTLTAGSAVKLNKASNCRMHDLVILAPAIGIELRDSTLPRCANIYIINPTIGGVLIDGTTGNDQALDKVFVAGGSIAQYGFRLRHTGAIWLDNCGAIQCATGMLQDPTNGQTVEHVFSERCAWDTCSGNGLLIAPEAGGIVRRGKYVQDWAATNGARGVYASGAGTIDDVDFGYLRAYNNGQEGVYFERGSNLRTSNHSVSGNSTTSAGTYAGIRLGATSSHTAVHGGRIGAIAAFSALQSYGVEVDAGATYYSICLNDLVGNATGALADNGAGPRQIWGNLPETVANVTSSTTTLLPIGQNVEIKQVASTGHLASNAGGITLGIVDGSGLAGISVNNTHDGTYSSTDIRLTTGQGGVSVATERLRVRPDGVVTHRGNASIVINANSLICLRPYTVATLPAAEANQYAAAHVVDGGGGKTFVESNGTNWLYADGTVARAG